MPALIAEKIGQLLVVGFRGTSTADPGVQEILGHIEAGEVGGVILFRYNIEGPSQTRELLANLKAAAPRPLLTVVDQEGGKVQRLHSKNGFLDFLSAKRLAAELTDEEAFEHYREMGETLHETGFNFNCAPCVDLDGRPPSPVIGAIERSYSSDPERVADLAQIAVEAFRSCGVLSCLKHYPGHGRAPGDTHTGLVDITETWTDEELRPYELLIKRQAADAVMSAHLIHRRVDERYPATLSSAWLRKLRQTLGFDGVVMSDDLHMSAILLNYTFAEMVLQGLGAGLDLFVFSNNPLAAKAGGIRHDASANVAINERGEIVVPDQSLTTKFTHCIATALQEGKISEAQLDAAFQRVTRLKENLAN